MALSPVHGPGRRGKRGVGLGRLRVRDLQRRLDAVPRRRCPAVPDVDDRRRRDAAFAGPAEAALALGGQDRARHGVRLRVLDPHADLCERTSAPVRGARGNASARRQVRRRSAGTHPRAGPVQLDHRQRAALPVAVDVRDRQGHPAGVRRSVARHRARARGRGRALVDRARARPRSEGELATAGVDRRRRLRPRAAGVGADVTRGRAQRPS